MLTGQRSLHDPHGVQPASSPHHYGQGYHHYGYANIDPYGSYPNYGGGYHFHHQNQHPYMNMGSPKANPKADSSKGKKEKGGIMEGVQAAAALTGTVVAQFVVGGRSRKNIFHSDGFFLLLVCLGRCYGDG